MTHQTDHVTLSARVDELERENRRLRERAAWAMMCLRECMDQARRALGDLETELVTRPV